MTGRAYTASGSHRYRYLSIYLSIYLSVYLAICLSIYLSICMICRSEIRQGRIRRRGRRERMDGYRHRNKGFHRLAQNYIQQHSFNRTFKSFIKTTGMNSVKGTFTKYQGQTKPTGSIESIGHFVWAQPESGDVLPDDDKERNFIQSDKTGVQDRQHYSGRVDDQGQRGGVRSESAAVLRALQIQAGYPTAWDGGLDVATGPKFGTLDDESNWMHEKNRKRMRADNQDIAMLEHRQKLIQMRIGFLLRTKQDSNKQDTVHVKGQSRDGADTRTTTQQPIGDSLLYFRVDLHVGGGWFHESLQHPQKVPVTNKVCSEAAVGPDITLRPTADRPDQQATLRPDTEGIGPRKDQ
ncbi:unnamed protein product [Acanthosepion pharaonis]|uniref:Uncharacterized protein n=1 Tax=Acanthosepion pharaonis TaxID=158019 RepID=A0A812EDS4_ACAPH|nr:unnamed protein product [Sepia pharaonis]